MMQEVELIMTKFNELGLPLDHPGVQEFIKVVKDYEIHKQSASGRIPLMGFKRNIVYILSMQPHIHNRVMLENAPHT